LDLSQPRQQVVPRHHANQRFVELRVDEHLGGGTGTGRGIHPPGIGHDVQPIP
jgi:hypothetical protein